MDRQSEVALLEKQLSELGTHKTELDAVIRRYIPQDDAALVPGFIDPVMERLKKMTAEELLPFVLPGTGSRKQITQRLREGHISPNDLENLVDNVVRGNLLLDEVSARAVLLTEWTTKNEAELAAVRSRYKVIIDNLAEIERQIEEAEDKYESLTNLYEVTVNGTETQSRSASGTIQVRALSVEEAIDTALSEEKSDDIEWSGDGYYEDHGEYEASDEVDESDVKLIEENVPEEDEEESAKSAGV